MKRLLIAVLAIAAFGVMAAQAQASVGWPANCRKMACVNKHLNALHNRQASQALSLKLLRREVNDLASNTPPTNNALQAQITALQGVDTNQNSDIQNANSANNQQDNQIQNLQVKINCIGHKTVYYGQAYDYYEGYYTKYLSLDDAFYNGDISGPFSFLTDTCGGTF